MAVSMMPSSPRSPAEEKGVNLCEDAFRRPSSGKISLLDLDARGFDHWPVAG